MCRKMWEKPSYGTFKPIPLTKEAPWPTASLVEAPLAKLVPWQQDEEAKINFGIELGKAPTNAFEAACKVFKDTTKALWASKNWINDPITLGARDSYLQIVENQTKLLDKTQFKEKLLHLVDEKSEAGFYFLEGKERISLLKLYADVEGWTNKVNIDASTINNANTMNIVLIKSKKEPEIKTVVENPKEAPEIDYHSPINLKLVSNAR